MKILVITHYYPPEIGAPQARLSEMAQEWVTEGHEVQVVTCFPNHPTGIIPPEYATAYRKTRYMEEVLNGVHVARCWVFATPNKGFARKVLGHLTFMFSAVWQAHKLARGKDVIVVSSPTFFSVFSAWLLSKIHRAPYIFEVRDLWPAIFVELGVLKNKLLIKTLEFLELFLYRQSKAVVTVTQAFADNIAGRGIDRKKLSVIYNGANTGFFRPKVRNNALAEKCGVAGKFVIMYLGAHGISHALNRIVEAAALLCDTPEIRFVFVGEGAEKELAMQQARTMQLENVLFFPGQPKEMVPEFYSIMDIGLVPLRNVPLFDTFIPSKMFEIMAMEKAVDRG